MTMTPTLRFLAVLGCVTTLAATAQSAAVPTTDTVVVSRSDDSSTTDAASSSPEITTETATEGHTPPIKLTEMDVKSVISLRYAHTAVVAHVRNPAKRAQEANFRVLLPKTAFISGFVMIINGKSYKAYVKEKEEAKQIYQTAVSQGFGAAHVAAQARDSNHFTVSLNVEPSSSAVFNLTYEELLVRRNGVYNHAINLHPGELVPKFTVKVIIKESADIKDLRVPEIRTGNEIDATKDDAQMSNVVIESGGRDAVISFSPDLDEQQRLMAAYAEKSKESAKHGEGVLGQFVVQYDVARPKDGEILVNDGYFVHFFAPTDLRPLSKYVVFVLDTSGSMYGRKIEQLREAMKIILSELNPGDFFSIVDFDSTVRVHDLEEANQEPAGRWFRQESTLVPPSRASPENIEKAKVIVSRLEVTGATNIIGALNVAVDLIKNYAQQTNVTSTSLATPPASENSSAVTIPETADEVSKLEPTIIFLTDGEPNVGESNPNKIISLITEKNIGKNKATIFSLSFGRGADRKFLRKLSLRNEGFMRHIYEAADAALQLRDFYRQVSSPLLADVKFVYPPEQVMDDSVTNHEFRTFYAGSEVVVAGRVTGTASYLEPQLHAFCNHNIYARRRYDISPKVPIPVEKHENMPLERLWAYLTIKQLLDKRDRIDDPEEQKKENSPEKKALALALKYEFVTPLTSLVVVKPNETNAVNAESADKLTHHGSFLTVKRIPYLRVRDPLPSVAFSGSSGFAGHWPTSSLHSYPSSSYGSNPSYRTYGASSLTGYGSRASLYSSGSYLHHYSYPSHWHTMVPTTGTTPVSIGLSTYHLENYSWVEPLLDTANDALVLQVNGTVTLKLTKDIQAPKKPGGDAECDKAIEGGAGLCVYLTRCDGARNITIDVYKTSYCQVDGGYAGVCCPRNKFDLVS